MVVKPKIKSFICTTAHPQGCLNNIEEQINRVKARGKIEGGSRIKNVLIVGGSTGYGLSTRIVSSFGLGANTLNICLERPPKAGRTASPGWYNTAFFEEKATAEGYYAGTIIGDGFSDEVKTKTIEIIKKNLGKIDLFVYSVAAPKRIDPITKEVYQAHLKSIGKPVESISINPNTAELTKVMINPATQEEIDSTVKVMGGEDWKRWVDFLERGDVLSEGYYTFSYSYIGPEVTKEIYRKGTIGMAKVDLEKTAILINQNSKKNAKAHIVVNKALVTHASSAIPILPLYVSILYKVMKENNNHEDCLDQIDRLFRKKIKLENNLKENLELDDNQMIRMDDWEMETAIQTEIKKRWEKINNENLKDLIDIVGYQNDFLKLFGFGVENINYDKDVNEIVEIKAIS